MAPCFVVVVVVCVWVPVSVVCGQASGDSVLRYAAVVFSFSFGYEILLGCSAFASTLVTVSYTTFNPHENSFGSSECFGTDLS